MPSRLRTAAAVAALAATGLGLAPGAAGAAPAPPPDVSATTVADAGLLHDHVVKLPPRFTWPINAAPTYNDYLVCVGSWLYVDFTDPNGGDATLDVTLTAYLPNGSVQVRPLDVSDGAHGVFFHIDRAAAGVLGATVSTIRATDVWGATSETVVIDAACDVLGVG